MRTCFIIDKWQNQGLLRFTETKIWFDAFNRVTEWVDDIKVVDHEDQIDSDRYVIIESGDYVNTALRQWVIDNPDKDKLDFREDGVRDHIIKFTPEFSYNMRDLPPYKPGEKQRYILDNLFRTVLKAPDLIYLEQTEPIADQIETGYEHLYGVSSAWKTVQLAKRIGLENLKSVTVYDVAERQLNFAKSLWEQEQLPLTAHPGQPCHGEYDPPQEVIDFWQEWHNYPVEFVKLNLFDTPRFKPNSYVWVSNAFLYEPSLFKFGYEYCQTSLKDLRKLNNDCKITIN